MGNRQSAVFKITMAVYAKSVEAKDDLRAFVWDFGQEYNQTITLEDVEDYMMTAALHPAQVRKNSYFDFRVLRNIILNSELLIIFRVRLICHLGEALH